MANRGMSKWVNALLDLAKAVQGSARERDRLSGKTTRRADPPNRCVEHGVRVEYSPDMDGDADPGEVVWTWVPFEEDRTKGKDRPVVIIGRTGSELAGVPLTSKDKGRADHVPVGTGAWDPKRRDSWAKVDRLIMIDPHDVRREGAALAKNRFDEVVANLARYHDLVKR